MGKKPKYNIECNLQYNWMEELHADFSIIPQKEIAELLTKKATAELEACRKASGLNSVGLVYVGFNLSRTESYLGIKETIVNKLPILDGAAHSNWETVPARIYINIDLAATTALSSQLKDIRRIIPHEMGHGYLRRHIDKHFPNPYRIPQEYKYTDEFTADAFQSLVRGKESAISGLLKVKDMQEDTTDHPSTAQRIIALREGIYDKKLQSDLIAAQKAELKGVPFDSWLNFEKYRARNMALLNSLADIGK